MLCESLLTAHQCRLADTELMLDSRALDKLRAETTALQERSAAAFAELESSIKQVTFSFNLDLSTSKHHGLLLFLHLCLCICRHHSFVRSFVCRV